MKKNIVKENDGAVKDVNTGKALSIGDIVRVGGLVGEYQIGVKMSEGRPFLMPYSNGTADKEHLIYLTSLSEIHLELVDRFSNTDGGFMSEGAIKDALRTTVRKSIKNKKK
jgi:hypothetical protein